MTDFVGVSCHAAKRAAERMGIPRRAIRRLARKAWQSGWAVDPKRRAASWNTASTYRRHGAFVFVFVHDDDFPQLVTVYRHDVNAELAVKLRGHVHPLELRARFAR